MTQKTIYILFGLVLFCYHCPTMGQQNKIDSLVNLLRTSHDTSRINVLNAITRQYRNKGDYDKAIQYASDAKKQAEQIKYHNGIANALINIAGINYIQGNLDESLKNYDNAYKIRKESGDKNGMATCYLGMGNVYSQQGNYPKAIENYILSLRIKEELGDKDGTASNTMNIGTVYLYQKNYSEALKYFSESLKIRKELNDNQRIAESLANIGATYIQLGIQDSAVHYLKSALKISENAGDLVSTASCLINIGSIYLNQGKQQEAMDYFAKSLKIQEELGNKQGIVSSYSNIGGIYRQQGNFLKASEYFNKMLIIANQAGMLEEEKNAYHNLSGLYFSMENYKDAYSYFQKYSQIKDSIFTAESSKQLADMSIKYQTEKKENQIKLLEKDKEKQEIEGKEQRIVIWSVISGLLLVIVFSVFMFNRWRITQLQKTIIEDQMDKVDKAYKILDDKNKIIEEKNKDIIDSINYALRIQHAYLPGNKEIYSVFPQCFILFKPKEVVSGDFYFFHKKSFQSTEIRAEEGLVFIAAADCTGHGVPGAFMSIVSSERLEDAITYSSDTSEILRHLNKGIKNSLHQSDSDESTRDGMDIAICSIDTNNRVVKYAGANRPLWIIRNGQAVVEEIKATKKAIGGLTEDDQHFDTHTIQLHNGDTFYISTDGYADTFSGADSKKLTTKRFKEILISIQDKSLKEQGQHLDNFIENWKAGTEQVDDILVIGIRF